MGINHKFKIITLNRDLNLAVQKRIVELGFKWRTQTVPAVLEEYLNCEVLFIDTNYKYITKIDSVGRVSPYSSYKILQFADLYSNHFLNILKE